MNLPDWWRQAPNKPEKAFLSIVAVGCQSDRDARKILKALDWCKEQHEGQLRGNGDSPYFVHPIRCALSLADELGVFDPVMITAALLHDTVEDTDASRETLKRKFGAQVAELVHAVTRSSDKEKRPKDKIGDRAGCPYIQRVIEAGDATVILKLADKIDNLRDAVNHPSARKRGIYVREAFRVYVPLLSRLRDKRVASLLRKLLGGALKRLILLDDMRLSLRERYLHGARLLAAAMDSCEDGGSFQFIHPDRRELAQQRLLFNPRLDSWLYLEGERFVKRSESPRELLLLALNRTIVVVGSRKQRLLHGLEEPDTDKLREEEFWQGVAESLRALRALSMRDDPPSWFLPMLSPGNTEYLILLCHSRLIVPSNRNAPLPMRGPRPHAFANVLEHYRILARPADIPLWRALLEFLTLEPESVIRSFDGVVSLRRVGAVAKGARKLLREGKDGPSAEILASMRLTAEHLDFVCTRRQRVTRSEAALVAERRLAEAWNLLGEHSCDLKSITDPDCRLRQEPYGLKGQSAATKLEWIGYRDTLKFFSEGGGNDKADHRLKKHFGTIVERLIDKYSNVRKSVVWIHFDTLEFRKRLPRMNAMAQWEPYLKKAGRSDDLEELGITIVERLLKSDRGHDLHVRALPSRRFALMDRVPEAIPTEIDAVERAKFAASAIFDAFIDARLDHSEPLWMPRVYRILDSMEALDPEGVQRVDIRLHRDTGEETRSLYFPLAQVGDGAAKQARRKEAFARYLAFSVYNAGLIRRLSGATVECHAPPRSRRRGLNDEDLIARVARVERDFGIEHAYRKFIETFNHDNFEIRAHDYANEGRPFLKEHIGRGRFLGVDIGGTDIKLCLFDNGRPGPSLTAQAIGRAPTFPKGRQIPLELSEFVDHILDTIDGWLKRPGTTWRTLDGIGVSWPGAVRGGRIAGGSGVLRKLKSDGASLTNADASAIHSLDLPAAIRAGLRRRSIATRDRLSVIVENDGNAEAYGNYCRRLLEGGVPGSGRIVLKLGTSLAGGRIDGDGVIADDVSEYGKPFMLLNAPRCDADNTWPMGIAREYVSSFAVRRLSRIFEFNDAPLFGNLDGTNSDDVRGSILGGIESHEIGELLDLYAHLDENGRLGDLLVRHDNKPPRRPLHDLPRWGDGDELDEDERAILAGYVRRRGQEMAKKKAGKREQWRAGIRRTLWILQGALPAVDGLAPGELPSDFSAGNLRKKAYGAAALFSQLGLQLAHLVALLYNAYGKSAFREAILAGGVLTGSTGDFVQWQAERFLTKYYYRLYGPGKALPKNALVRISADDAQWPADSMGPFGAAMLANRRLCQRE
ncbi:MAG: hypothetical protein ACI8UO_005172 [Verrucomicrobiales bacterium]|jgi:hypothetical protein